MKPAIVLVKTRQGCVMCETEPRYDVLLHGQKVEQLYYNMRGYVGYLPTPRGTSLDIGERGITAFKREVSLLNREWAQQAKGAIPCDSTL